MIKSGKRAFSVENAIKNIPPEVVNKEVRIHQGQRGRWCVRE
jgi:hypothetical protein